MKKILNYLLNNYMFIVPMSRFFRLKAKLWRLIGHNVSHTARLYSTVKMIGDIEVSIGEDTFIGHETLLTGGSKSKILIGNNCDISSRVVIVTGSHHLNPNGKRMAGEGFSRDIVIGNGVWIGAGVTILGGVTIGDMSMIAAGSVVNKDIQSYTLVGGVPIRRIRQWNIKQQQWEKY